MHQADRLHAINAKGRLIKNNGCTFLGTGVLFKERGISKEMRLAIPDADRGGHFGCFGTTRVGKTRLIENIVEQDIRKGYNVVVIDPKGDAEIFSKIVQVAAESGRLDDILLLTPIFPECSIKLDPLSHYYMEDELVDHVVSGIKAKEDYFIAIASEVTQAIISSLSLLARVNGEKFVTNFGEIKKWSGYYDLKELQKRLDNHRGMLPEIEEVRASIEQILASPQDHFAKVASSLRTTVSALSNGNTGKIIGRTSVNEFVKRFEEGRGVILFCNTGSLLARRTAHIVGRVLVSMIQSMIGRFYATGRKLNPPLCLHIDEGHNVLYQGIQELFNKGGGANAWVHIYTQSIAQMELEIGREGTRSILDNINTLAMMLVNHPETAQYMENCSPLVTKSLSMLQSGGGMTLRQTEERRILGHYVLELPKRYFYMKSYGKLYKGYTTDVSGRYVNITFPDIVSHDHLQETEFLSDTKVP